MSKIANLQINHYAITRLIVVYDPDFLSDAGDKEIPINLEEELDVDFEFYEAKDDSRKYLALVKIVLGNKNSEKSPIHIEFEILGTFVIDNDTPEDEVKKIIPLNPVSILYGISRGILGPILAQGPMPGFVLPSVNFIDIHKSKMRKNQDDNQVKENQIETKPSKRTRKTKNK